MASKFRKKQRKYVTRDDHAVSLVEGLARTENGS